MKRQFSRILPLFLLLSLAAILTGRWLGRGITEHDIPVFALLQVDSEPGLSFGREGSSEDEHARIMTTQAQLVTSPNVLRAAAGMPQVSDLSAVRKAPDSETFLRDRVIVEVIPDTSLIRVRARSLPPAEASAIIDAVVEQYLNVTREWLETNTQPRLERLERYEQELIEKLRELNDELTFSDRQGVPLPGGTATVSRAAADEELKDCLRQLRRVRLEATAARSHANDKAATDQELPALKAQESQLVAEATTLAEAIAASKGEDSDIGRIQAQIGQNEAIQRAVHQQIEAIRFEQLSGSRITLLSSARAF